MNDSIFDQSNRAIVPVDELADHLPDHLMSMIREHWEFVEDIPDDPEQLTTIKGIGQSSAATILKAKAIVLETGESSEIAEDAPETASDDEEVAEAGDDAESDPGLNAELSEPDPYTEPVEEEPETTDPVQEEEYVPPEEGELQLQPHELGHGPGLGHVTAGQLLWQEAGQQEAVDPKTKQAERFRKMAKGY